MIIESDNLVFIVEQAKDNNEGNLVKAVRSEFTDDWIIFSENEYGELSINQITEMEFQERYGKIPSNC